MSTTTKITPEQQAKNFEAWMQALEGDEFVQGIGVLHRVNVDDEYCCLGVACELHRRANGGEWLDEGFDTALSYMAEEAYMPSIVGDWMGLRDVDTDPSVTIKGNRFGVATHNDRGVSFKDIAAALRAAREAGQL